MYNKAKDNRVITTRDWDMMKYMWQWKVISAQALGKKFFPDAQPATAQSRLVKLKHAGYVQRIFMAELETTAWGIDKRGFKRLLVLMHEDLHHGYKSEYPYHDFLTTALHLGEWLTKQPEGVEMFTERELRCIPDQSWPEWVPQSKLHRPDGYTRYQQGERNITVAFEVELSLKTKTRYEPVAEFYEDEKSVDYVFWLVQTKSMVKSLRHLLSTSGAKSIDKHNFLLVEDFLVSGWSSPIIEGCFKNQCLKNVMSPRDVSSLSLGHHTRDDLSLLDTRRSPINSSASQSTEIL